MFATVLVGYDETDQGADALALGRTLADADGRIVVCCVYPPDPPLTESLGGSTWEVERRLQVARDRLAEDPAPRSWPVRAGRSPAPCTPRRSAAAPTSSS